MTLRTAALASIVFALIIVACGDGPSKWHSFTSTEAGFSAEFPGEPTRDDRIEVTEFGDLAFTQFRHVDKAGTEFVVSYSDVAALTSVFTTEEMLDALAPRVVLGSTGELLRERVIDLDGHPGRDFSVRVANGSILRMRGYLVEDRSYQVGVVTSPENQFDAVVERFLDSFQAIDLPMNENLPRAAGPSSTAPEVAQALEILNPDWCDEREDYHETFIASTRGGTPSWQAGHGVWIVKCTISRIDLQNAEDSFSAIHCHFILDRTLEYSSSFIMAPDVAAGVTCASRVN